MRIGHLVIIFFIVLLNSSFSSISLNKIKDSDRKLSKTNETVNYSFFDVNNISTYIYNNGEADTKPDGNSGFVFPKGTNKRAVYTSGLVWGGKINNEVRVGGSTYRSGLLPGKISPDGTAQDYILPSVRVFRVRPDYKTAELFPDLNPEKGTEEEIRNQYELDWNEWPANDGAPFNDIDNNGIYNPQIDIPGIIGADQTLWFIANDLDPNVTKELYGSLPMGIEMQVTVWGYTDRGIYNNMLFKKYKLINKSNTPIDSMYISIWSDPDLGDASDDFVGCDTLLNLAYVYNGNINDATYGLTPPAVGFALLQGPRADNDEILNMTSFHNINKHGDDNFHEPNLGEYEGSLKYYNFMQGRIGNGEIFPIPDVFGGGSTKFPFSGDPNNGTGFIEGVVTTPRDRRMAIGSGPFTLAVGDTQEIVFAEIAAQGKDNLNSLQLLKYYVKQIPNNLDDIKDIEKFHTPIPPQPDFSIKENIHTNDISFSLKNSDEIENFNSNGYTFQGYNIYQLSTDIFDEYFDRIQGIIKIATYDISDGITEIYGQTIDTKTGEIITELVQAGADSGVNELFSFNYDYVTNTPLIKGKRYTYAVTAYYYNPSSGNFQNTLESLLIGKSLTFKYSFGGVAYGDTLFVENNLGTDSEILVEPLVVNPEELTDHTYHVSIYNNEHTAYWNLTDLTLNKMVVKDQPVSNHYNFHSNAMLNLNEKEPIIDGMLILVSRKNRALGNFKQDGISVIKYNNENLITPYDFYGFGWSYQHLFSINSISYSVEDLYVDAKYLLPYDYELRFTDNDNYAIDYWDNNKIISVPFELWNIGIDTHEDSIDDIRMIPFVKMQKDTSYWSTNSARQIFGMPLENLGIPASDWIYWMKPDIENGGYTEFAKICKSVGIGGEYDTTMDNSTQGFYTDFQGGFNYVMGNMVIVDDDNDGNPPPAETIIRFSTLDPVSETNNYTFTSEKQIPTALPYTYEIFQNYPNPFNPNTTIRFSIAESGPVKLTVYNLLGQKVKELVNRKMQTGEYEVSFYGDNLASGIYFYQISTEQFVKARKMILLK